MSRQSKAAKKHQLALEIKKLHLNGQRGPASSKSVHTKSDAKRWCKNRTAWYSRATLGSKSIFQRVN